MKPVRVGFRLFIVAPHEAHCRIDVEPGGDYGIREHSSIRVPDHVGAPFFRDLEGQVLVSRLAGHRERSLRQIGIHMGLLA